MKPTKEELVDRISRHLEHRRNNDSCNLLWAGYLAACLEWRLISISDYDELRPLLREVGEDEVREIFLGVGQHE
jgi:glucose-6-phosphate dehydrogenase assembly protein OpcA